MFEVVSVPGGRAAVWSPAGSPRAPRRVLIPGPGGDVWACAASARDAADAAGTGRDRRGGRPFGGRAGGRGRDGRTPVRSAPRRVVVPGDPPAEVVNARRLGVLVPELAAVDDAARERWCDDTAALGWADAVLELGCWRSRLDHTPPGAGLAAVLEDRPDGLAPGVGRGNLLTDHETSWADAVLASVQARARLIAHLHAAQYADLADLSGHYPAAQQFLAAEIALALSCTESLAGSMLGTALALRDRLPATWQALSGGIINEDRADAIVAATTPVSRQVAAAVEAQVLPGAATVTAATVRRRCERAIIAADPGGADERHQRRRRERYVSRWPEPDGMAGLKVYSTATDIATIHEALTVLADQLTFAGDSRDLGNRRVDALLDLCTGTPDAGPAGSCPDAAGDDTVGDARDEDIGDADDVDEVSDPGDGTRRQRRRRSRRRARPLVRVTMPFTALLGADEPCDLDGWGPITAQQARTIAADATLTRLVCDPLSGTLLDYGLTRYTPPDTLKDFIRTRDRTCCMPGCGQPADRCDIDHVIPARPDPDTGLPTQGPTAHWNLGPDCRHHHLTKDANGGYHQTRNPDGSYTWTTPLARTYHKPAEQLWHPPPTDQRDGTGAREPLNNTTTPTANRPPPPDDTDTDSDPPPY